MDYEKFSLVDIMRIIGELEHTRFHAVLAAANAESDDEVADLLLLAKHCQDTRRNIQHQFFGDVKERHWCLVKTASSLMQIMNETADGDQEYIKSVKSIVDETISIATGKDISGCESCKQDIEA